jgi:hypothetical protein
LIPAASAPAVRCCQVARLIRGATVEGLYGVSGREVAVGFEIDGTAGPTYRFSAWWSRDGRHWAPAAHDVHGPTVVLPVDRGLVGVGYERFVSRDGRSWAQIGKLAVPDGAEGGFISDALRIDHGFLAVGTVYKRDRWDTYRSPGVWRSAGGRSWRPVATPDAPYESHFDAVTRGGPGLVVAGYGGGGPAGVDGVWTSPDGIAWTRVLDADLADAFTLDVASSGGQLVLVGAADGGQRPAAWVSDDGLEWQRAPGDAFGDPVAQGVIQDVVAIPGGYVASGSLDRRPTLWTSADGLAWHVVSLSRAATRALPPGGSSTFTCLLVQGRILLVGGVNLARGTSVVLVATL